MLYSTSKGFQRRSSSCPSDLNILLQLAEFSWQQQPTTIMEDTDYFDKIEEAAAGSGANRRNNLQAPAQGSQGPPPTYESLLRSDDSDGDDLGEAELGDSGLPKQVLRFVNPSVSPVEQSERTRRVGRVEEIQSESPEDEDDEYFGSSLKRNRRRSGTRPPIVQLLDQAAVARHKQIGNNNVDGVTITKGSNFTQIVRQTAVKVSNTIPGVFRPKGAGEYKIQIFVAFMFLTIVLLVGSIYVIHEERELQKAYFDRIRFAAKDRRIRVSNLKGKEVLSGILGTSLTAKDRAWECLEENRKSPAGTCLEWMNIARLYFRITNPRKDWDPLQHNMQCYEILWEGLNPNFVPKDCYYITEQRGFHFYGGGEVDSNPWPLHRTSIPLSPFITGKKVHTESTFQFGQSLRPYFVASPGAAIEISRSTPLHISINEGDNGMLCFTGKTDSFAYPIQSPPTVLNYTLCTGETVKEVFNQLADKEIWNGLREFQEDVHAADALAASPTWKLVPEITGGSLSESALLNHTDHIAELQLSGGFLLLDESWQKTLGDLEFDLDRFPNMGETANITRRRGFKIALTIQPFFSLTSTNFIRGNEKGLWVRQYIPGGSTGHGPPAVTTFKGQSVVLLDITRKGARAWIHRKLSDVIRKYSIEALYIDFGSTQDFPRYSDFAEPIFTPDEYKEIFMRSIKSLSRVYAIGTTSAIKLPKLPTFVTLSPTPSTWAGLQTVIPNVLSLGVAGFPFITPGVIGGDYAVPGEEGAPEAAILESVNMPSTSSHGDPDLLADEVKFELDSKPDRELYARWLELVHFLPVVQYTYLPSHYDSQLIGLAREFKMIRKTKLYPYIKKAIHEALITGLPIVRPLWMSDPTDTNCLKVWDEFTIGGDVLVAPILTPNTTEREIYLPKGRWRDEKDGSSTKGERWIHHYRLSFKQVAYFTKLEDPA